MISGARYGILGLLQLYSIYGALTSADTAVSARQVGRGGHLAGVRAGGVPHGIERVLGAGVQAVTLVGRLITCGINLLWSIKIHKFGWGQMYTHVKKSLRTQIWREGLSGLKQDGPNRHLGASQQLWSISSQKGHLGEQLSVQSNPQPSTNVQTTIRSD